MQHDQPEPESTPPRPEELLRQLEQRLDRASSAAERLLADAVGSAARADGGAAGAGVPSAGESGGEKAGTEEGTRGPEPPPAGWQMPESDTADAGRRDVELIARVLHSLQELIPPDLAARLGEALHELLLAVRALIDWYLERVEQRRREPPEVQDIPIA